MAKGTCIITDASGLSWLSHDPATFSWPGRKGPFGAASAAFATISWVR